MRFDLNRPYRCQNGLPVRTSLDLQDGGARVLTGKVANTQGTFTWDGGSGYVLSCDDPRAPFDLSPFELTNGDEQPPERLGWIARWVLPK